MANKLTAVVLCFLLISQYCFANEANDVLNNYYGNNTEFCEVNFSDISEPSWAVEPITYLAKYGIVSGADGMFYPQNNVTRDQFIKILILSFGLYDITATCDFIDVSKDSWQYPYVATAKKLGITLGISSTEFGVDMLITRQQMVTLVYNIMQNKGFILNKITDNTFDDNSDIESYALNAVTELSQSGIITGDENNRFNAHSNATRAEACKIIYSLLIKNS